MVILSVGFLTNYWAIYIFLIRFKQYRLNYHYDFIFKKRVFYRLSLLFITFSLTHCFGQKKGDRERENMFQLTPPYSSAFFGLSENHDSDYSEVCNRNMVESGKVIDYLIKLLSFLYFVVIITMASSNGLFHCLIILQHDKFK